jgi:structural maintenance of chromosome 4
MPQSRKKEADSFLRDQNELVQRNSTLWQLYCRDLRYNIETAHENVVRNLMYKPKRVAFDEMNTQETATKELQKETDQQAGSRKEIEMLSNEYDEFASEVAVSLTMCPSMRIY